MALGDVVDVDDVQAGVDIGRHTPRRGVADHLAGRGRLDVARADRGGGIDHHHRDPVAPRKVQHGFLGEVLGPLVDADEIGLVGRGGFIGRRAVADLAEGGDRTAVDDAFGAGLRGGAHHRDRAVDVGSQHRVRVGNPEAVVGGDMADDSGSRRRRGPANSGSVRSPVTISASRPARLRRSLDGRVSRRKVWPRAARARATAEPTKPVAPVTRVVITTPFCREGTRKAEQRAGERSLPGPAMGPRVALIPRIKAGGQPGERGVDNRHVARPCPGGPARAEAAS